MLPLVDPAPGVMADVELVQAHPHGEAALRLEPAQLCQIVMLAMPMELHEGLLWRMFTVLRFLKFNPINPI
jgi:hypothetical protein